MKWSREGAHDRFPHGLVAPLPSTNLVKLREIFDFDCYVIHDQTVLSARCLVLCQCFFVVSPWCPIRRPLLLVPTTWRHRPYWIGLRKCVGDSRSVNQLYPSQSARLRKPYQRTGKYAENLTNSGFQDSRDDPSVFLTPQDSGTHRDEAQGHPKSFKELRRDAQVPHIV